MGHIDVIIVTYNSSAFLENVAKALANAADISSVTVLDNGSSDGSPRLAEALDWGVPVKVIAQASNSGFGAAVNLAARAIEDPSEYMLILNPDASMLPGGLARLVADLDDEARLACVGAQLRRTDGSAVSSARVFPSLVSLARRRNVDIDHRGELASADWVCGALMLWRRIAFDDVGGFSTNYFLYFEDTDICRRASVLGWRIAIDGRVDAVHDQGHARPTTPALRRHSRRSRRRYAWHWFGVVGIGACAVADAQDLLGSGLRSAGVRR